MAATLRDNCNRQTLFFNFPHGTVTQNGQTITPSENYVLETVKFYAKWKYGDPGTCYISIQNTTAGLPNGDLISDKVSFTVSADKVLKSITFSTQPSLVASTVYAIVFEAPNGTPSSGELHLYGEPSVGSYYTGGDRVWYDGGTWTAVGSQDLNFYCWGIASGAPGKPTTPSPANNATGVNFSGFNLSWAAGTGETDTYNVYIGETGNLTLVSSAQAGASYVTTLSELETIFSASPIDQKIYWRVDATNEAGTTTGDEWNFDARPAKATVPSPEHQETGVKFSTTPLSYTVGDTVDVYFKIQGGSFTKIADAQDVSLWRTPYVILNIKDYNPATLSGYRSPKADDVLTHGDDSYTVAYVVRGDLINVQYQAKLYAFRTEGPGAKSPGDVLTNGVAPDVDNPQAVRVTLNDQGHFRGDVEEIYLPPSTTFVWRIDATNTFGTSTGDEWEFTTPAFKQPKISYNLISGGSGSGPYDYPPGAEGTDWDWSGENNMISVKRLVAAARNKIWYENI